MTDSRPTTRELPQSKMRAAFASVTEGTGGEFSARHLITMAAKWRVTTQAMCLRLEALDLLPAGTLKRLKADGLSAAHEREVLGG